MGDEGKGKSLMFLPKYDIIARFHDQMQDTLRIWWNKMF
jgi:hypothetical protein